MTEHTPGPWRAVDVSQTYPEWQIVTDEYECQYIADVMPVDLALNIADTEANARLISAAPDLLAALEAVLQDCDRVVCPLCGEARGHSLGAGCDLATQAIAKARGERVAS